MAGERGGTYRLSGQGSDLRVEVLGPDLAACLAAAVAGFAAAVGRVDAAADRRHAPVELRGATPEELLVALLDEAILRLDADAALAVDLTDAAPAGGGLRAVLETVDLAAVDVHGPAPKAATWHDVRLEQHAGRWRGAVVLDL